VRSANAAVLAVTLGATAAAAVVLVPILRDAHGSYPVPDATSTALSVAAQSLLSLRLIQNWYLWIAADLIYVPLYMAKGLYFTSILYAVFLVLCAAGLVRWRAILGTRRAASAGPPAVEAA
jgi:nicotinamide mononucleotide transporter